MPSATPGPPLIINRYGTQPSAQKVDPNVDPNVVPASEVTKLLDQQIAYSKTRGDNKQATILQTQKADWLKKMGSSAQ